MNQAEFTRRYFLKTISSVAALAGAGRLANVSAAEGSLKIWANPVHKVGGKDWSAMEKQAGIRLAVTAKSARGDRGHSENGGRRRLAVVRCHD